MIEIQDDQTRDAAPEDREDEAERVERPTSVRTPIVELFASSFD